MGPSGEYVGSFLATQIMLETRHTRIGKTCRTQLTQKVLSDGPMQTLMLLSERMWDIPCVLSECCSHSYANHFQCERNLGFRSLCAKRSQVALKLLEVHGLYDYAAGEVGMQGVSAALDPNMLGAGWKEWE